MAGFGQKRISKKQKKTKDRNNLPPERLRANAIKQHISGNLDEAERDYLAFIHTGVIDPDVLSNYALICQETGRITKALSLYEKSIKFFPDHPLTNANLGYLYLSIGEVEKAELATRKAIELSPNIANSYSTLGLVLKTKGNLKEAEEVTVKAIAIQPDFADAYLNLGLIQRSIGKLEEAAKATQKAIDINPNSADAHLNLGTILQDQGLLKDAENMTRKAIYLQENITDANMNLGAILKEQGKLTEALMHVQKEIDVSPNKQAPYLLLNTLFNECDLTSIKQTEIRRVLGLLLPRKDINHMDLFRAINELIKRNDLIELSRSEHSVLTKDCFHQLVEDKEIVNALRLLTFNSSIWENALTKVRKDICVATSNDLIGADKSLFEFTTALAEQCFLNEYIFYISDEEIKAINKIKFDS